MVNRWKLGVELSRVELKWSVRFILYERTAHKQNVLVIVFKICDSSQLVMPNNISTVSEHLISKKPIRFQVCKNLLC